MEGIMRFGKKRKLTPSFVGPFRNLQRAGKLAYRLDLPPSLSHVHPTFHVSMLRAYDPDPSYLIDYSDLVVEEDTSYLVILATIIDRQEKVLQGKDYSTCESAMEVRRCRGVDLEV